MLLGNIRTHLEALVAKIAPQDGFKMLLDNQGARTVPRVHTYNLLVRQVATIVHVGGISTNVNRVIVPNVPKGGRWQPNVPHRVPHVRLGLLAKSVTRLVTIARLGIILLIQQETLTGTNVVPVVRGGTSLTMLDLGVRTARLVSTTTHMLWGLVRHVLLGSTKKHLKALVAKIAPKDGVKMPLGRQGARNVPRVNTNNLMVRQVATIVPRGFSLQI